MHKLLSRFSLCRKEAQREKLTKEKRRKRDFALSRTTNEVIRTLEAHFDETIGLDSLAERAGVSRSYLSRLFKREVGMGIHEYLMQYRTVHAAYLLKEGWGVAEVGYACGFCDSSHFIAVFKRHYGITPAEYRKASEDGLS